MSWNGSGVFNRIYSWVADRNAGLDISSTRMDTDTDDIASSGFGNCLTRDGQGGPTANLPMGNFRHTGVANGLAATDYAALGQTQSGTVNWTVAAGTSDALTATFVPALGALIDGQIVYVRALLANLTTTPTVNGATITKWGGKALAIGDIAGPNAELILRYNLGGTRWELLNPPSVPVGGTVPFFGGTVPAGFALPQGQNLSAATFPAANAVLGTTYGNPGGGNFTMPDLRGRTVAGLDAGGSARITVAGGNFDGTALGTAGGGQNHALTTAELASHTHTVTDNGHTHTVTDNGHAHTVSASNVLGSANYGGGNGGAVSTPTTNSNTTGIVNVSATTGIVVNANGSGTAHTSVQPTMVINVMMRIA